MALLARRQRIEAATNEGIFATSLLVLCIDTFGGTDWFDWMPETFDIESKTAFGFELPALNKDKINALLTVLQTNLFYVSLETFIPICNALNNTEADFEEYDPADGEEIAWALVETSLIDPPEKGVEHGSRFSHEIRHYTGLTLKYEGLTSPPRVLSSIAEYDKEPEEEYGAIIGPDKHLLHMHERRQQQERAEIEAYIKDRAKQLIEQLESLPLRNASGKELATRAQRHIQLLI